VYGSAAPNGGDDVMDGTGVREEPPSDRVLATVLFTDLVESTKRASELGDSAWRDLLDRHDATVRRQLDRYRGTEVGTAGDSFLATFDGPARAIQCALAVRDNLAPLGLDVRAGLHTGEIERRGDDVRGIAVHIGARVAALAGPGEVLASSTVKDLVVGSGIAFTERGTHMLKGVPDEWRLFAVRS
jgi:class 3 adenylate cyclase